MVKINDAHVHLGPSGPWKPDFDPSTTIRDILEFTKVAGIERCVVFPNPSTGVEYPERNNYIIEAANAHPRLFVAFGRIDPRYKKNSRREIKRLADKGVVGIKLHPRVECFRPDHPFFSEIYEAIQRFGMIILAHTGTGFAKAEYWKPVCEKYRRLTLILAHFNVECVELLRNYDNVYAETSASNFLFLEDRSEVFELHKKILFGSDYPYVEDVTGYIRKILDLNLPKSIKKDILYNNFNKLFRK